MNKAVLVEDLSKLTNIPIKSLNKVMDLICYCITDVVNDGAISGESSVEIDIGIGTLKIGRTENSVKYLFIPSAKLEEGVKNTIIGRENALEVAVESSLQDKLVNTYKELV